MNKSTYTVITGASSGIDRAATKTEFGSLANDWPGYDYAQSFANYHHSEQVADFLLRLYDSDKVLGLVDRENFTFQLLNPQLPYAGNSIHNQQL